jgi:hypothetical protein
MDVKDNGCQGLQAYMWCESSSEIAALVCCHRFGAVPPKSDTVSEIDTEMKINYILKVICCKYVSKINVN